MNNKITVKFKWNFLSLISLISIKTMETDEGVPHQRLMPFG